MDATDWAAVSATAAVIAAFAAVFVICDTRKRRKEEKYPKLQCRLILRDRGGAAYRHFIQIQNVGGDTAESVDLRWSPNDFEIGTNRTGKLAIGNLASGQRFERQIGLIRPNSFKGAHYLEPTNPFQIELEYEYIKAIIPMDGYYYVERE